MSYMSLKVLKFAKIVLHMSYILKSIAKFWFFIMIWLSPSQFRSSGAHEVKFLKNLRLRRATSFGKLSYIVLQFVFLKSCNKTKNVLKCPTIRFFKCCGHHDFSEISNDQGSSKNNWIVANFITFDAHRVMQVVLFEWRGGIRKEVPMMWLYWMWLH